MPWCPKCKSEYREGFSICADCGSELVGDEQFAEMQAEERARLEAERFEAAKAVYMATVRGAGFGVGQTGESGTEEAAFGCTGAEDAGTGEAVFGGTESEGAGTGRAMSGDAESECIAETAERKTGACEAADTDAQQNDVSPEARGTEPGRRQVLSGGSLYRDNAERASENRSSAWVLMVVGGLGIVVLILGITGVIPLHFSNAYLFYGVMAAIFILFVVAGIVSMKNALKFEKSAESENSVKAALLEWCGQNLRAEELDRLIGAEEEASKEILYFKRFEAIKARLNHQFLNLDQGFLEKLIDDTVYEMVYGEDEEAF